MRVCVSGQWLLLSLSDGLRRFSHWAGAVPIFFTITDTVTVNIWVVLPSASGKVCLLEGFLDVEFLGQMLLPPPHSSFTIQTSTY